MKKLQLKDILKKGLPLSPVKIILNDFNISLINKTKDEQKEIMNQKSKNNLTK